MDTTGMTVTVGMADFKTTTAPNTLITLGLGSCVGVVLYDEGKKIAGMAHVMLPDSTTIKNNVNKAKFADTAIEALINELVRKGCSASRLKAKIAGGAKMLNITMSSGKTIGERNVEAVKGILAQKKIPIVAEDVGLNTGRTIAFNIETAELTVKSIGRGTFVL